MSQYEKVLSIHPSGKLVGKILGRQLQVHVQEMSAFVNREEVRSQINNYLYGLIFLPMPVHVSPIIVYISPLEWEVRYWDSIRVISFFIQMIHAYVLCDFSLFHTRNKPLITKEYKVFLDKIGEHDRRMMTELKDVSDYKVFVKKMETYTIDRINVYERFFYKILQLDAPEECFLTPQLSLPIACLTEKEQQLVPNVLAHFFDMKQHLCCEKEDQFPFNVKDIALRLKGPDVYNGFLDKMTAEEYIKFIKNYS
jgi:hypothetical protein